MKQFHFPTTLLAAAGLILFFACGQNRPDTKPADTAPVQETPAPATDPDQAAIENTVHGFYAWYDEFQKDESRNIIFTVAKGSHLRLDPAKLDRYFANLKAGGFISDEFVENEKDLLKRCEALWQQEDKDEPGSCLDADRFFCAQDWDVKYWTSAGMKIERLVPERVAVILSDTSDAGPDGRQLELKKENGKWLIATIECEMGIE